MNADPLQYRCGTRPNVRDRVTLNDGKGPVGHVAVIIEDGRIEGMTGYDAETWAHWGPGILIDAESKGLLFVQAPTTSIVLGWHDRCARADEEPHRGCR